MMIDHFLLVNLKIWWGLKDGYKDLTISDLINFGRTVHPHNCQVFVAHHSCQGFGSLVVAYLEFSLGGKKKNGAPH